MKKIISLLFLFTIVTSISAQEVRFTGKAVPDQVRTGENFQVQYTVNADNPSAFKGPAFDASVFEVLAGPYTSQYSSYQYVNGKASSSSSVTYTYTLCAVKKGTFTLAGASVSVSGKRYISNKISLRVGEGSGSSQQGRNSQAGANAPRVQDAGSPVSGKDLFITATASKTHVYEQEAILLTYKVYTTVNLTQLEPKMPDLKGFHVQQIDLPQTKTFTQENHNGRLYNTVVWSQYVLFPQQTGKMSIPSISFEGIVAQRNRSIDPFDAFFNSGSSYTEVKKKITTPSIQIVVDPMPTVGKPANFSGGVGRFDIKSAITPAHPKSGEAITFKVTVSGVGNMKLLKTPTVEVPKDFEAYDPKITDNTKLTKNGMEGNKVFEYVFVPRNPGKYTIPSVKLAYFDLASKAYKTIATEPYDLTVVKGKGGASGTISSYSQEDVEELNTDIRYIKTGNVSLKTNDLDTFFNSSSYLFAYVLPLLIFIVIAYMYRKQAIENANLTLMRAKKANKVARKCLRIAKKKMQENNREAFYDEIMRALYGYVSDKLSMPIEQLNKDNIREKLTGHQLNESLINDLIKTLDDCEFARFAPSKGEGEMNDFYTSVIQTIENVDNAIK